MFIRIFFRHFRFWKKAGQVKKSSKSILPNNIDEFLYRLPWHILQPDGRSEWDTVLFGHIYIYVIIWCLFA